MIHVLKRYWLTIAVVSLSGCATVGPSRELGPCAQTACDLSKLAKEISTADYRGQSDYLRLLASKSLSYLESTPEGNIARYWRGFALWREALNRLNGGASRESVDSVLSAAIAEFGELLVLQPKNVEAMVGLAGCLQVRIFLWADDSRVFQATIVRAAIPGKMMREIQPDNLRVGWIVANALYRTPESAGGGRALAITYAENLLSKLQPANLPDALQPQWGRVELMASLAWMLNDINPGDKRALEIAIEALALRPDWYYLSETLIPALRKR